MSAEDLLSADHRFFMTHWVSCFPLACLAGTVPGKMGTKGVHNEVFVDWGRIHQDMDRDAGLDPNGSQALMCAGLMCLERICIYFHLAAHGMLTS